MKNKLIFLVLIQLVFTNLGFCAKPKILFVRSEGVQFQEVFRAMNEELATSYEIKEQVLEKSSTFDEFKALVTKQEPQLLILMDNKPVEYALKYNAALPNPAKRVKGVALMSLNLKQLLKDSKEISGIAFEPSAYLLVTQFRYLLEKTLKNVVVFYRKSLFQNMIREVQGQLKGEGIELIAVDVETKGNSKAAINEVLKENLKNYNSDKTGALWVLLDSALINQISFNQVWMPAMQESRLSVITGTENLISTDMKFGVFAITPNLPDLAHQAIQQVESILKDHRAPTVFGVEEVVSINKILNTSRAKEIKLQLRKDRLTDIKLIE
ncbi:MAG: hypothetical protein ABIQ95_06105 [Bdellovibrionia bacterium]